MKKTSDSICIMIDELNDDLIDLYLNNKLSNNFLLTIINYWLLL